MLLSGAIANYPQALSPIRRRKARLMLLALSTTPSMRILMSLAKLRGALACVVLVLLIWLYQSLKFRNRPLAVES